jgi:hypothetical protein
LRIKHLTNPISIGFVARGEHPASIEEVGARALLDPVERRGCRVA